MEGLFGDKEDRERRRRARKSGGGGVSGSCTPGKSCPIPTRTQRIKGKIKYKSIEPPPPPVQSKTSHVNPRDLGRGVTPEKPEKLPLLKRIFGRKQKASATY